MRWLNSKRWTASALAHAAILCFMGCYGLWVASGNAARAQDNPPAEAESPAEAKQAESKQATDEHADETPATDEHATDEHATDEHATDEPATDEHASDEHASDEPASDEHGHHDPYDLSHGNATEMIEDPSEFKSDLAIWTFVVFLCLLALLMKFAWGPIVGGLDRREQAIADKIEEAKRSADQAAQQLKEYEAKLAAATEEAQGIVGQARQDAEAAKERIVAEAQEAAQRERQRAVEDITMAKNVALQEITERSVDLAEVMAGRLLHRELQATDRAQLVKEALEQLPSQN